MVSVQILRGVAALMVVMFHILLKAQILNLTEISFPQGAAGVDLFFIISGFIMVYITDNKDFHFFDFLKKRLLRILPLYWMLSLVAALVYIYNPAIVNSHNGETSILSSFSLIPIDGKVMLLEVGWTLRYEFLFYFLFSLSLFLFKRHVATCFIIIGMICMLPIIFGYNFYIGYISNPIIIEFLFGMNAYFAYKREILKTALLAAITCVILTIVILFISHDISQIRAVYYGLPMLVVFMTFIYLEKTLKENNRLLPRAAKYIGDASYSIYLSHTFTIAICAKLTILFPHHIEIQILFIPLSMAASIIVGVLCYELIEKPIHKLKPKKTGHYTT